MRYDVLEFRRLLNWKSAGFSLLRTGTVQRSARIKTSCKQPPAAYISQYTQEGIHRSCVGNRVEATHEDDPKAILIWEDVYADTGGLRHIRRLT
jgi:hypothetical protein